MNTISRRNVLTAAAAGGLITAATAAGSQTAETIPQPMRPGQGGIDRGPRDLTRDRQNPDLLANPLADRILLSLPR